MAKKTKWIIITCGPAIVAVAVLLLAVPEGVRNALGEYFRPSAVKMIPLPEGCFQTRESPPANLMQTVEYQKRFHNLVLQKVVICRSATRFHQGDPVVPKEALAGHNGEQWLPLYVGCCAYKSARHVAVVVAGAAEDGSVIVEAALIQPRWDYLRSSWVGQGVQ